MTTVAVYSYTQSVTYVSDNILKSLKDIIRLSGMDPSKLVGEWDILLRGISRWIESKHLEAINLEIYDSRNDKLLTRWDVTISYGYDGNLGNFYTDTDQLRYAIKKTGVLPSDASYRVVVVTKPGYPDVQGWGSTSLRSTNGMIRQSLGTTIEHNGLGAGTSYWRQP